MAQLSLHFIIPLYKIIFEEYPPCMSQGAMEAITKITDWYFWEVGTFFRVFSEENPLHILPRYATDILMMKKLSYYLATGLLAYLHKKKRRPWPTLPLKGLYEIKNLKVVDVEGKEIVRFAFGTWNFNLY